MLYKSLICIQGYDNGLRHAAICGAVYLLLLVLGLLFGGGSFIWVPGILLAPVLLLSCRRRLGDGGRNPWLSLIALLPWLILLLALSTDQAGSYLIGAWCWLWRCMQVWRCCLGGVAAAAPAASETMCRDTVALCL